MKIVEMKVRDIIPYENNPRKNENAVDAVAASISEFGFKVPIIVDKENVIVAGHTRLRAAEKLGLEKVPVIRADDLTDEQVAAFRLADNKTGELATWDFDKLEEELSLIELDMSKFGFVEKEDTGIDKYSDGVHGSLAKRFVIPPFSVLNSAGGDWQDRKSWWRTLTGDLSETRDGDFGKISGHNGIMSEYNGGTSNFDPVLAEVSYRWFCIDGGSVLDPWGGEQTKGVVAGELGYQYTAIEIRPDQVDVNKEATRKYTGVKYICGDSNDIDKLLPAGELYDMVFSSPPYYDLEIYSAADMSSLGTYEEYLAQYKNILRQCFCRLKEDSFAVIKVGEIRDKKTGVYRSFVPDTINIMTEVGFNYYNEIILVTPVGTGGIRAAKGMKTRKVMKRHQNVLVFYKGDVKNIMDKYGVIEIPEEYEEIDE